MVSRLDDGCPVVLIRLFQSIEQGIDLLLELIDVSINVAAILDIFHQWRVILCCCAEHMRANAIEKFGGHFIAYCDRSVFESLEVRS